MSYQIESDLNNDEHLTIINLTVYSNSPLLLLLGETNRDQSKISNMKTFQERVLGSTYSSYSIHIYLGVHTHPTVYILGSTYSSYSIYTWEYILILHVAVRL